MNICNFCFSFDYNIGSNFSFHMKLHFLSYFMMFCIISIEIYMDIIAKYIENSCRMVSEKPENFSIKYYIFLVFSHKKRPPLWWSVDRQNLKFHSYNTSPFGRNKNQFCQYGFIMILIFFFF